MGKWNNERGEKMRSLFLGFIKESSEEMDETISQLKSCDANDVRCFELSLRAQAEICSSLYTIFAQVCDDFSFANKRLLDMSCINAFDSELDRLVKKKASNDEVIKMLSEYRAKLIDYTLWN